jgi:hypothetical protein
LKRLLPAKRGRILAQLAKNNSIKSGHKGTKLSTDRLKVYEIAIFKKIAMGFD